MLLLPRLPTCVLLIALLWLPGAGAAWETELASPGGLLQARIGLDDEGRLWYQLMRAGEAVLRPSPLGISLHNTRFESNLELLSVSAVEPVTDSYRLWTGKRKLNEYRAHQRAVNLANTDGHGMSVVFRLSDDGLAFRYEFPGESADTRVVTQESSGFHFFGETRAWLQPKANAQTGWSKVNPSYEEDYLQDIPVGTPSPVESGWVYPALFRYRDTWMAVAETGMDGTFAGSNFDAASPGGLYRVRYPQPAEVITNGKLLPEARLPFHSPWRLLLAGDLATIVDSTLGTDLAEPNLLADTGFVQPGIAAWSWGLLKDDATVYPVQQAFVDYAAGMNWPYVLVDADWDQKIGHGKIAELSDYAAGKGVGLLLWYNSSGAWNETVYTPKSRLLTRGDRRAEFGRLHDMGIRGVKVDFFPGDGRSVMQYYLDILRDAADFELLVNFHGSTLPRGLQRTFPNHLTSEAIKGLEFITFEQQNAEREATHCAMLPFTRNLFDPMDFTPMVLGDIPNIERRTSNGFQLALPVLFTSGIQHLVTTPDQMETMPGFVRDFLRDLPGQWDDSRFIDGFPGRYVIIARQAGERWYVAGINAGPQPLPLAFDLAFLPPVAGLLIRDGEQPRELTRSTIAAGRQELTLPPASGFVMVFKP